MTDQTPASDPDGQPGDPATEPPKFDFAKAFAALTAGGDNVAGTKVEPSAQHRATARDVAQQFTAYRDEGFTRVEALALATMPMQTMLRVAAEEHFRKENGDQS